MGSPCGGSSLMMSAPRSARICVAYGPERNCVRSSTRMPASGRSGAFAAIGSALENVDRAGAMVEARNAAASGVRQAHLRALHLARARFAAQLAHDLDHLRRARCADGMAFGEQPAGGIDGNAP